MVASCMTHYYLGNIIATNLRGKALGQKLKEIYGE